MPRPGRWRACCCARRIREGLPIAELLGERRHAVAALIADGLIDGAAAVHGRVVLTRRGRLLADAVVRALTDVTRLPLAAGPDPVELALRTGECQ